MKNRDTFPSQLNHRKEEEPRNNGSKLRDRTIFLSRSPLNPFISHPNQTKANCETVKIAVKSEGEKIFLGIPSSFS